MARLLAAGALLISLFWAAPARAQHADPQDRVVLRFEDSGSQIALTCTVVEYTGREITLRPGPTMPERTYPASQVVSVETPQTRGHVDGLQHFARGVYDLARERLEVGLGEESRAWVRREILAMLVRCALRQGDYSTAASRFILLASSDPDTPHFKLIPLEWRSERPDESRIGEARNWMAQSGEVARLLGASVLMTDERYRQTAAEEVQELRLKGSSVVRHLAQAQLWRLELGSPRLDPEDLRRWQADIERMPEGLRAGPNYVLGRAAVELRQYERAAMALLWLPLVADHDHHLAGRACLEAGDALASLGQRAQAAALYREVTERFHDTPAAQQAAALVVNESQDENR